MKFIITGSLDLKEPRSFKKEVEAPSERAAVEKVYALFGSNNGLKRRKIKIEKVEKA